jgi:glycosyltransferase 2 family protein
MSRLRKHTISSLKLVLAFGVSGLCLYYSVRNIEINAILNELANVRMVPVLLAALISFAVLSLRAWRWHQVLRRERDFAFSNTYWANAIGYLANSVLPARAGDLIRSVVLGLSTGIRKSLVLATSLTERMLDAAVLLLLAWFMLLFTVDLPPAFRTIWTIALPAILSLVVVAFISPFVQIFWVRCLHWLPVGTSLKSGLEKFLNGMLDGVRVFHNPWFLGKFLFLTLIIWCVDATLFVVIASAFGATLTFPQSIIFVAIIGFASSVPSTPGYVGVYQAIAVALLPVFGMKESQAFLLASFFQLMFLTLTLGLGSVGWVIMQRRIGTVQLRQEISNAEQLP